MVNKSLIELAYEFLSSSQDKVSFAKIWDYVKEKAELSDEEASKKVGQFYTNIMLDGRFVTLGDNDWDLRSRHTFDKVHIDMKDVYSDVETSDDDEEEENEEKEYNEVFDDKNDDSFKDEEELDDASSANEGIKY